MISKGARLLVASERADPAFHVERVMERIKEEWYKSFRIGVLLITKDVESVIPILELTNELLVQTVLHATMTGLAKTAMEPRVPIPERNIASLTNLMNRNYKKLEVVLRVDPLIPKITNWPYVEYIVEECSKIGIKRCRTSVVDYYPFVRAKFKKAGYPYCPDFQVTQGDIDNNLAGLGNICNMYDMSLELCAEVSPILVRYGALHVGCANQNDWGGHATMKRIEPGKQRKSCFCNVRKYDLLPVGTDCHHGCLYCYYGRDRW